MMEDGITQLTAYPRFSVGDIHPKAMNITFQCGPQAQIVIHANGEITWTGELTESARLFLDAVRTAFPDWLREQIAKGVQP